MPLALSSRRLCQRLPCRFAPILTTAALGGTFILEDRGHWARHGEQLRTAVLFFVIPDMLYRTQHIPGTTSENEAGIQEAHVGYITCSSLGCCAYVWKMAASCRPVSVD